MTKNFRTRMITSMAIGALSVGAVGIALAAPASATETSAPSTTITQSNGMVVVKNNSDHDIAVWMRWNRGANQQDWMVPAGQQWSHPEGQADLFYIADEHSYLANGIFDDGDGTFLGVHPGAVYVHEGGTATFTVS